MTLMDVGPDPVGIGAVLAVVIFVIASVCLLALALVGLLWYRKRRLGTVEMVPRAPLEQPQPSNPNQP
jgi:hypothetical protein